MYKGQRVIFIVGLSIITLSTTHIWVEAAEKPGGSEVTIDIGVGVKRLMPGEHGWTELMEAIVNGDMAKVNVLLEKGVDVNAKDDRGSTALIIAASTGNLEIAKALLNRGADVNIQDKDGMAALMEALMGNHIAIAQLLLEKGANTDDKTLFLAVWKGHRSIVDAILKSGIDVNIRNIDGKTPLMIAAEEGHTAVVETLLNKGADVNSSSEYRFRRGETALMSAAKKCHITTVQVLLANGADANARDDGGRTPLMEAVECGENTIIKTLIAHGADVNARDNTGATALIYSAQKGLEDTIKILLENGADVKIEDNEGQTAVVYADVAGHKNVVRILLESQTPLAKAISLLYIQQEKNRCNIKMWEPRTQFTKVLYALKECPKDVYVDEHTNTIFITTKTTIQEIVFMPTVLIKNPIEIPFKIDEVEGNNLKQIGYLKNGSLVVVNERVKPADDSDIFLYEFDKSKWTLVKQRYCERFENCGFNYVSGKRWSAWRKESQIWHPMLSLNPFIVDRGKVQDTSGQLYTRRGGGGDRGYIKISVNGHQSILYHYSEEGAHSFGLYTFSIYLKTYKDNKPIELSNEQCNTAVEYKYLLLSKYSGKGLELIDLETGEKLLKELKFAFWIY